MNYAPGKFTEQWTSNAQTCGWMDGYRIRNRYLLNTEEKSRDGYRCIYSLNETSKLHDKEIARRSSNVQTDIDREMDR
jgi:hypothetical protein